MDVDLIRYQDALQYLFARTTGGGHAIRQYALTGAWRVNYGARWDLTEDHVKMTGGERRDRDARVSPIAGVTWHGGKAWVARLGTQSGYQRPTLYELMDKLGIARPDREGKPGED